MTEGERLDPPDGPWTPSEKAELFLVVGIALTVILYLQPCGLLFAWPLLLLSTIAHEMGHGIAAILTGGTFLSFTMNPDGSGLAWHMGGSGALVSAGGLVGPAVAGALLFVLARREIPARIALLTLGLGLAASEVLVVTGAFARIFVGVVALTFFAIGARVRAWLCQLALVFVAVQLSLSVFARGDYLFTDKAGDRPSDVAHMASALGGPYWFWGIVCGLASLLVLWVGTRAYLKGLPRPRWRRARVKPV